MNKLKTCLKNLKWKEKGFHILGEARAAEVRYSRLKKFSRLEATSAIIVHGIMDDLAASDIGASVLTSEAPSWSQTFFSELFNSSPTTKNSSKKAVEF